MLFDIILPSIISMVTIAVVLLYNKFEAKLKTLFEEKEFRIRDTVILVIAMGLMVSIIVLVPQQAIQILFLAAYSFILFLFTYVAADKWYLALVTPSVFLVLYLFFWNLLLLNVFAILFAIMISVYMGGVFSWKTVLVFAGLLTVMDVVQVFLTEHMVEAAYKFLDLRLPVMIFVNTFPREGWFGLGLGDVFLAGLLSIQTMKRFDRKAGALSAISIGAAFFVYETIVFYYEYYGVFPATIVVLCGWLLGLGLNHLVKNRGSS